MTMYQVQSNKESGFTLVELVIVIMLLGILASVALPRFMDLSDDAHKNTVKSTAGALSAGVSAAHAKYLIAPTTLHFGDPGTGAAADIAFNVTYKYPNQYLGVLFASAVAADGAGACVGLWNTVLDQSRPSASVTESDGVVSYVVTRVLAGIAVNGVTFAQGGCKYIYRDNVPADGTYTEVITYDVATGSVARYSTN